MGTSCDIFCLCPIENVRVEERSDKMTIDLKRLKSERVAKGFTQDEMAEKLGWKTRTPYAKRENGLVGIGADELGRIAYILGYTTNELGIFFTKNVPEEERRVQHV